MVTSSYVYHTLTPVHVLFFYNTIIGACSSAPTSGSEAGRGGCLYHEGGQTQEGSRRQAGSQNWRLLGSWKGTPSRPAKVFGQLVQVRSRQHTRCSHHQDPAIYWQWRLHSKCHSQGVQGLYFDLSVGQSHAQVPLCGKGSGSKTSKYQPQLL